MTTDEKKPAEPPAEAPRSRTWWGAFKAGSRELMRDLNTYAGLLNVMLGVIGALYLVNEWQARQDEARIKAIEALTASAPQSRAALVYLARVGANLEHQNLTGANISGLRIDDAGMADARLDGADMVDTTLTGDLSALSVRCADISNVSLQTTSRSGRPIDARGARIGMNDATVKAWSAPVVYTSAEALDKLGKAINRELKGELLVSAYFKGKPGAIAEQSMPSCLYDRLVKFGITPETLCKGGQWDGIAC